MMCLRLPAIASHRALVDAILPVLGCVLSLAAQVTVTVTELDRVWFPAESTAIT